VDLLNQAIKTACRAHEGQVDKGGEPYILHPLRVMLACKTMNERIVAVLHDVVEDSNIDFAELRLIGIPAELVEAVSSLSWSTEETYKEYIMRCAKNPLARSVKINDVLDNISDNRINNISESLVKRYYKALDYLENTDLCDENNFW
jgi:(p)ppGpp synthase/HD superfamily hydrolase